MYYLKKKMEVAGAHCLDLSYPSKCQNLHGHNWWITIYCKREELDEEGMIVDFSKVKEIVNQLDHANIDEVINKGREEDETINSTAENIAKWLLEQIPYCYQIDVQETANNEVSYVSDK